jgi:uncharacterized membrane protein YhiD involved in acid resistance
MGVVPGSALIVLMPLQAGAALDDLRRVLQGAIAGTGFLSADAIIKLSHEQAIRGLAMAASIWLPAAVGVAAGIRRVATAISSTLFPCRFCCSCTWRENRAHPSVGKPGLPLLAGRRKTQADPDR